MRYLFMLFWFSRVRSSDGGPGAEVYTDMLQKNMTPYITTQVRRHTVMVL